MVDIDFLVVEFNYSVPVALVEYKRWSKRSINKKTANYKALCNLADMANIIFICAMYSNNFTHYHVVAMNGIAKKDLSVDEITMSEQEYVKWLYQKRGINIIPFDVKRDLARVEKLTAQEAEYFLKNKFIKNHGIYKQNRFA